jgi:2-oxoglutarate ferredoxin oxidoreductase subunit alpha
MQVRTTPTRGVIVPAKKAFQIELDQDLCKGSECSICINACPKSVFIKGETINAKGLRPSQVAHPEECVGCGICESLCPDLAITVTEEPGPAVAVPGERKARPAVQPTGGWVTVKSRLDPGNHYMMGDEACAEGALAARCGFYAGYPITPASEIMVHMANCLPGTGGVFVQMEDEIGSMAAIIGASWAGLKSMTATAGPGFSLMMENISYACMTETPCVVVDIQRAGPSTGQASRPGSGDVMQAKWGPHGGVEIIALAPWSVQEMYDLTVRAFNLAERFRVPVILLGDAIVGHLRESCRVAETLRLFNRNKLPGAAPFGTDEPDGVPPMPAFGEGEKLLITGSTHDRYGIRKTADPEVQDRLVSRLARKILDHRDEITEYELYHEDGAQRMVVAYGSTARSALWAVQKAREKGDKVGMLRLKSIWPFPGDVVAQWGDRCEEIIVPEANLGQISQVVRQYTSTPVTLVTQANGEIMDPRRVLGAVSKESTE